MSKWSQTKDIPDNYDRDPNDLYIHKVDAKQLADFRSGIRPTVTAVCTKTWAPSLIDGFFRNKPRCKVCFPTRSDLAFAA